MTLPLKINKAAFDKLSDELKNEYKADGADYALDVDGLPDVGALTRANDRLKLDKTDLEKELGEVEKERDTLKAGQSTTEKDVARLQKKYDKEKADMLAVHQAEREKDRGYIDKSLRKSASENLAREVSTVPALMTPHILERTRVNFEGDEPVLEWINPDKTVTTVEKIRAEVVANKEFSPIIKANPARGGSASPVAVPGGSAPSGQQPTTVDLSKAKPAELVAHVNAVKAQQAAG